MDQSAALVSWLCSLALTNSAIFHRTLGGYASGGLTLIAALPIVTGTLLNGRDMRLRESVLLRTLGASARQVRTILVIEYATLGILAALTGTLLAVGATSLLAIYVFKTPPAPDVGVLLTAFFTTTAIAVLGGLALSRGVSNHPPLDILQRV